MKREMDIDMGIGSYYKLNFFFTFNYECLSIALNTKRKIAMMYSNVSESSLLRIGLFALHQAVTASRGESV